MKANFKPPIQSELNNIRNIYYPVKNDNYGRTGHRIISLTHHILIFGGVNAQNQYNPTTMKLDCETMLIQTVSTKNALKLQGFSLFAYNNAIYLWGGSAPYQQNLKNSICTNNMLKFTGDSFIAVEQKGKVPSSREFHASCFFKGRYLIIMGGNNGKQFLNDWHILDCASMQWAQITVNLELPVSLNPLILWKCGRGFLVTGQVFVRQTRQIVRDNKVYSFRFSDFKNNILQVQLLSIRSEARQRNVRGSPVGVIAGLESPYIILIGGQIYKEGTVVKFCDTIDCLNVQTLQWHAIQLVPQAACSFQALFINQKIYLVGGIANNRQINQYVQFIELKADYIEAKVCKVCRQLYGMKELPQDKNMNIKFEAQLTSRNFFNCEIISRMAAYINYPFSALGLLIDNSLNLSATNVEIVFGTENMPKIGSKEIQSFIKADTLVPFDYIAIYDNSFGFSQNQILQCLCSFTVKTQKYTSDKRYEEEIEIRKQYGINLKLGALRLGKSCLYITKTEENSRLVAYFSCSGEASKEEFTVFSYFLNADGSCSSEVNRRIIYHNVKQKLPANYQNSKTTTTIFIFDIVKREITVTEEQGSLTACHQQSPSKIFRYLKDYFQSLYLIPFTGRKISINKKQIKCRNYVQIFRKDEQAGKISKITDDYPKEILNVFCVHRVIDQKYFMRNILFYHKNRLIFVMNKEDKYCGVVQLNEQIHVDICKTKIQNRSDQLTFLRVIKTLLSKYEEKRVHPPIKISNPRKLNINKPLREGDISKG